MTVEDDEAKSQVLRKMFDEIMKMIHEKQIKLETILQNMIEHDKISHDVFVRMYGVLTEHGKKKGWL